MASKDKSKTKKKKEVFEDNLFESDDTFAFIAGYTSGGFAYGITWEEMEEIEQRDIELMKKENYDHDDKQLDLPFD